MKVLVNKCYGGYGTSVEAGLEWLKRNNKVFTVIDDSYNLVVEMDGEKHYIDLDRADPILIELYEEKGSEFVSGRHAELKLEEIPDDCQYSIGEYDGQEWIEETWINVTIEELKTGLSEDKQVLAQRVSWMRLVDEHKDKMQ
jgi:hypothetical protein